VAVLDEARKLAILMNNDMMYEFFCGFIHVSDDLLGQVLTSGARAESFEE
jgi:hypothetical protein